MYLIIGSSLKLTVSGSGAADVHCSAHYVDYFSGVSPAPGSKNTLLFLEHIATPILESSPLGYLRAVKQLIIRNSSTVATTVTLTHADGAVDAELYSGIVPANSSLQYTDDKGFFFAGNVGIDPWISQAIRVIAADYGVSVSLEAKNKDLLKFGRSAQVQTTPTTLMALPTGTFNETFVATNLINSIISTSAADGEVVVVEGHTISGSDLTFAVQTVTLNGQTAVALTTPLARATRVYNTSATELAGIISVTETDIYASGVPSTPTKVHLQTRVGQQQSENATTTISSSDYWVITSFYADMLEKTTTSADVALEVRLSGKVFRIVANISCSSSHRAVFEFKPYLIVPPNSDIRLRAIASANGKDVSGGIEGVLLKA